MTSRSKPSAMPLARRHQRQRAQEILVQRIAFAIDALLLRHLGLEPAALLARVGQFAEGVRQLHAAGIELEPLGHPRIARLGTGQRRLDDRVFAQDRGAAEPSCGSTRSTSTRLKRSDQVSSSATRMPAALGAPRQCVAVGRLRRDSRQQVDAGKPPERLGHGQALGFGERIGFAAAKGEHCRSRPSRPRAASISAQSAHQRLVGLIRAIPFEHREFGMMQRAALAIAEDVGEVEISSSPAASSFLQANSGEVCR